MGVAVLLASSGRGPPRLSPRAPIQTIAVNPIWIPEDYEDLASVGAAFDTLIAAAVKQRGLSVVPATECGAVWKRLRDSVGGYYSAFTGELDKAKYAAVALGTLRDLRANHKADAWIRSYLQRTTARWDSGRATWDGAHETVRKKGGDGYVGALSLVLQMTDMNGRLYFTGRGGIQVLAKFGFWKPNQFSDVPRDKLLKDDDRNKMAVKLALDSLDYTLLRAKAQ